MRLHLLIVVLSVIFPIKGFTQYIEGKYWVQFTDKNNSGFSVERPWEFLSDRALERREKQNIQISFSDLPVSVKYTDSLKSLGIPFINQSKWLNSVITGNIDSNSLKLLNELSFVNKIELVKPDLTVSPSSTKSGNQISVNTVSFNYGYSLQQLEIHNGNMLHDLDYSGEGMQIAVIDAGFNNADSLDVFKRLWDEERILGTRDFVSPGSDVFRSHSHGELVLSIIGGYLPDNLIGAAPEASFWLLRSEDTSSEYPIEEYNWISAAEFADSAGADVINSSLGYSEFSDNTFNHTYSDMDGNTTPSARGADLAASKGMLVVVSAGNQGDDSWKYITSPSDADSVMCVAAVDYNGVIGGFSSRGPGSDGDMKPNVASVGVGTYVVRPDGLIRQSSGTSLSAPIITGLSACLWQAHPQATNMDIFKAIEESADRFENPDTAYGYGIPDFYRAHMILKIKENIKDKGTNYLQVFPNPFTDRLNLAFYSEASGIGEISVFTLLGSLVKNMIIPVYSGYNSAEILDFKNLENGTYLIRIRSGNQIYIQKILKY